MSIQVVVLVCLMLSAGLFSGTEAAETEIPDLSGQWTFALKSGQQEVQGYLLLRAQGTEIEGEGGDHGKFEVNGRLNTAGKPLRVTFTRRYVVNNAPSGDEETFYGEVSLPKPHMSGTYTVPHKPGIAGKIATKGTWDASMLDILRRDNVRTYLGASDYLLNGQAHLDKGSYRTAIRNFTDGIDLNPNDSVPYRFRGLAYDKLGEHQKAVDDYTSAIGLNPDDAVAYVNRGDCRADLKQYPAAMADYDKAVAIDDDYATAYRQRGLAEYVLGQYQKAVEDFDKAIALSPNDPSSYYHRGVTHGKLGQNEAAIEDLGKAINFDPKSAQAYLALARAYSERNLLDDAIYDYTQAIDLNPEDKLAYSERGTAYARRAVSFGGQHNPFADIASCAQDYTKGAGQSQLLSIGALISIAVLSILVLVLLFGGRRARGRTP